MAALGPPKLRITCLLFMILAPAITGAHVSGTDAQEPIHSEPRSSLPIRSRRRIVFVRPSQWLAAEGDLWTVGASGHGERRLSSRGSFSGLAADGRRVACLGKRGIYVLAPPDWRPRLVHLPPLPRTRLEPSFPAGETWFSGTPCWRTGTDQLFVGAGHGEAGDGGLWLAGLRRHTIRSLLPPIDADFPLNDEIRPSPRGARVASGDGGDGGFWVRVADLRTGRQLRQPGLKGLPGVGDFAWLDEDNLLLAGAPGAEW